MKSLRYLVLRNTKLFFKDKGVFFTSLIAPLILLLLFITFLGNVYRDSFYSCIPQGFEISDKLINGFVGGWLLSSLLAVCCVTIAFSANMIMVADKVNGASGDLMITPVKGWALGLSYYISTALVTTIICLVTVCAGFVYLFCIGWYLSAADVVFVLIDVILLVLFGTALSSVICFFLSSQGGITAVTTIVSAAYGFLCGAYMPIASFSDGIQKFIKLLPGTYGTSLLHNHFMRGTLSTLENDYFPAEVVKGIRDGFDINIYLFDNKVEIWQMYLALGGAVAVLMFVYVGLRKIIKR